MDLSKSSVWRLLSHLGLSAQRPLFKSYKQDKKKVKAYLEQHFPAAMNGLKKQGAKLFFIAETPLSLVYKRITGENPVVISSIAFLALTNGALINIIMAIVTGLALMLDLTNLVRITSFLALLVFALVNLL